MMNKSTEIQVDQIYNRFNLEDKVDGRKELKNYSIEEELLFKNINLNLDQNIHHGGYFNKKNNYKNVLNKSQKKYKKKFIKISKNKKYNIFGGGHTSLNTSKEIYINTLRRHILNLEEKKEELIIMISNKNKLLENHLKPIIIFVLDNYEQYYLLMQIYKLIDITSMYNKYMYSIIMISRYIKQLYETHMANKNI